MYIHSSFLHLSVVPHTKKRKETTQIFIGKRSKRNFFYVDSFHCQNENKTVKKKFKRIIRRKTGKNYSKIDLNSYEKNNNNKQTELNK